jgi:VanZ family protein
VTASRHKAWSIAAFAYAVLIIYWSVMPVTPTVSVPYLDKAVHLCQYLLFAWLLAQAVRAGSLRQAEYFWLVWVYAASYGLLVEIIQMFVPWRSADMWDALANGIGAGFGAWIGRKFPRSS